MALVVGVGYVFIVWWGVFGGVVGGRGFVFQILWQ